MKALTVKQPWASLIVHGIKDIENRTWRTYFRGRVMIHAGVAKQLSIQQLLTVEQLVKANFEIDMEQDFNSLFPKGAIIGSVEIVDCVINHPSIWAEKTKFEFIKRGLSEKELECTSPVIYNWVLANPIMFDKPIPCKGNLSFWEFDGNIK